ncbi:hypothetical protein GCM10022258_06510 [Aquimarina gracilis]
MKILTPAIFLRLLLFGKTGTTYKIVNTINGNIYSKVFKDILKAKYINKARENHVKNLIPFIDLASLL